MRRFVCGLVLILGGAIILAGCNTISGIPNMEDAKITPDDLKPGDTGLITVKVKDRHHVVSRIEGVVTEEPRITFKLHDDGKDGDVKASDGIWSLEVDVPFQAPPGDFMLQFTAYNSDGLPVEVRDMRGRVKPLKLDLPLVIHNPQ